MAIKSICESPTSNTIYGWRNFSVPEFELKAFGKFIKSDEIEEGDVIFVSKNIGIFH